MSVDSPYAVVRARVHTVEPVSPNFARITFGGPGLDDYGTPGSTFDQRMKVVFPPESGVLPPLTDSDDWYAAWTALPEGDRGAMRTYSIRDVSVDDDGTRVVIDFVLHMAPGFTGPAATWASRAEVGDEVLFVGPRRGRLDGGGVEYAPGDAESVLLAGDETAAPAIARILEDSPTDLRGVAFIEVPTEADVLPFAAPDGVAVHWLPRDGAAHGDLLRPAVLAHLDAGVTAVGADSVDAPDGDVLVWETPEYSGLGEEIDSTAAPVDRYFWIAGESKVVTGLRRHLVKDLGVERSQVAFMGYWRHGVAMKG
ncbi:siderophore-interacting protein [Gordonia spumicola]|uniref:Siderophore-interacting protein n=1 Tax=Gordonia spumicola TaxID=589161 RepID=A0A7I9V6I9_9ACTN|nr:siderophore-interacting protein [Gordonia spumicola]GEE00812.1 siderophore-interacting protein [Gordonia spumicola]